MQQNTGGYAVQGVKSFIGREGHGFNATLTHNGRKVAFVQDMADGGMYRYDWLAKDRAQANTDAQAFGAFIKTLPQVDLSGHFASPTGANMLVDADGDTFLAQLVERYENAARFRRLLKTRLVLLTENGNIRTSKTKPVPEVFPLAAQKWPGWRLLNTLPVDEAVELMLAHADKEYV